MIFFSFPYLKFGLVLLATARPRFIHKGRDSVLDRFLRFQL